MKRQSQRSKSQDCITPNNNNQVNITIILSQQEQINIPVPINCPLEIINSLLTRKISELQSQKVIGFQSIPSNYSFDYRLSKNIGILSDNKHFTLTCLYNLSSPNISPNQEKNYQILPFDYEHQFFKKFSKYKICKPLSSGGFSRVYLVRNMQNGEFYAAKFMEKTSQVNIDRQQAILNQFFVHKSLNHPFIVKMEEYIQTDDFYILIMEYCPGGQLFTLLKNNRYMGEEKAKVIFIQILLAIKYLHDRNIVFRDIKPQNILIDGIGNAKLTDFGLAKQIRGKTNSYCGSVEYMAPEIVSKQSYSYDVDLYCMGALLYEILIGCPPFYNPNFTNNQTKYHICNSEVCFPSKVALSEQVKQLIASLLVKIPNDRLGHLNGVEQIFQHQWIGQLSVQNYLQGKIRNPFLPNLDIENFDRQQDQYQLSFRNKILKQLKKCKKMCNEINSMDKTKPKLQMKNKSQSVNIDGKKHSKSKSQDQLRFTFHKKKQFDSIKPMSYLSKLSHSQKQNPYAVAIKNKSMSQMVLDYKGQKRNQIDEKNMFKRKKNHRNLTKSISKSTFSVNKSPFDPQNTIKSNINKVLLVNSKSCDNSRKNSLYKKFIQNSNQKKSNKIEFMNFNRNINLFKPQISRQSQLGQQSSVFSVKGQSQIRSHMPSRQKGQIKQYQELYIPKNTYQKQNIQSKGLKRKTVLKKKFLFTSMAKDQKRIKQNHFMFEKKNLCEQQKFKNRQTVF